MIFTLLYGLYITAQLAWEFCAMAWKSNKEKSIVFTSDTVTDFQFPSKQISQKFISQNKYDIR